MNLSEFIKNTTPQQALNQIEQMANNGQIPKERFYELKQQAEQIGKMLGLC